MCPVLLMSFKNSYLKIHNPISGRKMRLWIKPGIFKTKVYLLEDMILFNEKRIKEMYILVLMSSGLNPQHTTHQCQLRVLSPKSHVTPFKSL